MKCGNKEHLCLLKHTLICLGRQLHQGRQYCVNITSCSVSLGDPVPLNSFQSNPAEIKVLKISIRIMRWHPHLFSSVPLRYPSQYITSLPLKHVTVKAAGKPTVKFALLFLTMMKTPIRISLICT